MMTKTLSPELLRKMNAYWRAANYLSVGQIYHYDNPLLKKPLKLAQNQTAPARPLGTTPGLNFFYGFTRIAGRLSSPTASGRNRPL